MNNTYSENFVDFYYAMGASLGYGLGADSWMKGLWMFVFLISLTAIQRVVRRVFSPTPKAETQ